MGSRNGGRTRPLDHLVLDHLVLDRRLPDGDGLELLRDLAERCPDVPVVVFTAYDQGDLPDGLVSVPESDLARLVDLLGSERHNQ
jgi:DNA-binding NarL/FixJ family response regulator